MSTVSIDKIITRLLSMSKQKPGKQVDLKEVELKTICQKARDLFLQQPILLELEAPLKICGDIFLVDLEFVF